MGMARFDLDPSASTVVIEGTSSVHPIRAEAAGLSGWVEISLTRTGVAASPRVAGEVRIDVERLRSGNPLVDRETRRRIDARRHPEIVGTVTGSRRVSPQQVELTGEIAFRGEVCAVEGELTVSVDGDGLHLVGEASFDVRRWGLQPPRVALLRVHPEITVHLDAVARAVAPA